MTSIKIYCIVVSFNGEKHIKRCLDSLHKSDIPVQIIVIDNNSTDETINLIKENYKSVHLILLTKNLGFGVANNIGLKTALELNADYFFLINQDAWIETSTLSSLLNLSLNNPEYGILSPLHLNGKGDGLDFLFSTYIPSELLSFLNSGVKSIDIYPCRFVNAAAWFINRKTLLRVGCFDPLFFMYGEDRDYINRLVYKKLRIGICPSIRIIHNRGKLNNFLEVYSKEKRDFINYLVFFKNINHRLFFCIRIGLIYFGSEFFYQLFRFRFKKTSITIKQFFILLIKLPRIIRHRNICKHNYSFFMD